MSLPILQAAGSATDEDLLRLFLKTELHWARHIAEETTLRVGAAFSNASLDRLPSANRVIDAFLPEGVDAQEAMNEIDSHFRGHGIQCLQIWPGRSAPIWPALPGWRQQKTSVHRLEGWKQPDPVPDQKLTLIPARAGYRHLHALAEQFAAERQQPQWVEAILQHFDDSHIDGLIALRDGVGIATAAVLSAGDIGRIHLLYVAPEFRRRGIGRTMLSRAVGICARASFKHVFVGNEQDDAPLAALLLRRGFRIIGDIPVQSREPAFVPVSAKPQVHRA